MRFPYVLLAVALIPSISIAKGSTCRAADDEQIEKPFTPPVLDKSPIPPFPLEIVQKRGFGRFIADLVISDQGKIVDVLVIRSFYGPFDDQLIALQKQRVVTQPAMIDGTPVASKCKIEYTFDI